MPPIRLGDGTTVAPKGFSEVRKGDGTILSSGNAIPDNAIAQFDASALSLTDGGSVTTWTDETGNGNDLTAGNAPTFVQSSMGGQPVVRFDGSSNYLDVTFGTTYTQPNTIITAIRFEGALGTADVPVWFDGSDSSNRHYLDNEGTTDDIRVFAGASLDTGYSVDNNAHLLTVIYNGSSSVVRVDGSQVATGDVGSQSLAGLTLGAQWDQNVYGKIDVGEFVPYSADLSASGDLSSEESRIADKYGITI